MILLPFITLSPLYIGIDFKILEEEWNPNSFPISIAYRIYYKVMKTHLAPVALLMSPKDEITLLLVNPEKVNASIPRTLKHSEITIGLKWRLEDLLSPEPVEPAVLNNIIEYKSGTVEVSFTPLRKTMSSRSMEFHTPETSFNMTRRSIDKSNFSAHKNLSLKGIKLSSTIPNPEYEVEQANLENNSPSTSEFNQLNVIKKYEINKDLLKKEFLEEKNKEKWDWFFNTFSQEQLKEYRENYYNNLEEQEKDIPYFKWFEENCLKDLHVNVLNNAEKIWKTREWDVIARIPPLEEVKFPNIQNKEVIASPFKMVYEEREIKIKDIQNIHMQLNCSNQLIHQIANEIILEEPKTLERSLVKPFKFTEKELKELKLGKPVDNMLEEINKKLDQLKINKINTLASILEKELGENFEENWETQFDTINKIKNRRSTITPMPSTSNYYNRPTLPDIQFEEWELEHPSAFDGARITEWNIDGMTDHQILRKTNEITMAALTYRIKNGLNKFFVLQLLGNFKFSP